VSSGTLNLAQPITADTTSVLFDGV